MAANTTPIFPLIPVISWGTVSAANNVYNGTGTVTTITTAGLDGQRVDYIKARALGTNVATVVRVFVNNGADATVAANNSLFMERTLAATTANAAAETADWVIPCNLTLPAGYKLNVVLGTAVAAGWQFTTVSGNY